MDDYITVLLNDLEDRAGQFLPGEYYQAANRESAALQALEETFTPEQHRLFQAYEDSRSDSACAYQDALARQAFLLARAIFR
ncbi:hypothetical protein [Dysosmobacter sp.]|uniref:hypothetical protein n=1 Tax=Dysosmobacter sp. TaxID=2591382 RepID=UPI003A92A381